MDKYNPYNNLAVLLEESLSKQDPLVKVPTAEEFIFSYAFTIDPHDEGNPIKRFPDHGYIKDLIRLWQSEPLLLLVKSRQMMATWLFVALNLWLARFHRGQYIFFISKKEDDAGYSSPLSLLSRALFMYNHLPEEYRKAEVRITRTPATLVFPSMSSIIHGVSQDSDAVRQYTSSSILSDEMAFQERSEQIFAAVKPTIDGGGRFTGVSTPNGKRNLFYSLVKDTEF